MTQLFVQTVPRHASWLLVGPPAATSLAPQQDITVTFSDSSSVVVPAGVPAALPGGGTTWDRTQEVVVGYVVQGSGTLLACLESQLGGLGTDYAPLVRVLADSVQVYQPQQPSGMAIRSGAWSGGASTGRGNSWSGGATVSSVPVILQVNGVTIGFSFGCFINIPAFPGTTTTLLDCSFASSQYFRLVLDSAGKVHGQFNSSVFGTYDQVISTSVPLSTWCWASTSLMEEVDFGPSHVVTALWNGGSQLGRVDANTGVPVTASQPLSATLGIGVSTSSALTAFPGSGSWLMSKAWLNQQAFFGPTFIGFAPPTTDPTTALALYTGRQSDGVAATLFDHSGNHYDAAPGPQGLTIDPSGPYA